jgi:SAM-dependent methyltransferase
MKVEIGGGTIPQPGYVNLDPHHGEGQWRRLVQDGIPVADGALSHVRASHLMEHIPAGGEHGQRVWVMNEVWRALRPGGLFEIIVPCVPQGPGGIGWHAFADPTHVSFWVYPESFHYFDGVFAANADYGIKPWRTKHSELRDGWEAQWIGEKP